MCAQERKEARTEVRNAEEEFAAVLWEKCKRESTENVQDMSEKVPNDWCTHIQGALATTIEVRDESGELFLFGGGINFKKGPPRMVNALNE